MVDLDDKDKSPVQAYIDGLEWEPLAQEFEGSVVRVSGVEGDFGNLTLRRDAEYGFDVSLESKGGADWADEHLRAAVPGTKSEGVKIEVAASDGRFLVLPNASLTHVNHRSTPKGETSTVRFYAYKAAWSTRDSNGKPSLLVDWFIGGPESDSVACWRLTNRDHGASYTRTRAGTRAELTEHKFASDVPPAGTSKASSRDYLTLRLPHGSVRLCQVPKTMTSWPSLRTDLRNGGANWIDEEVVVDGKLVTSRKPADILAFCREMIKVFAADATPADRDISVLHANGR